MRKTPLLIVGIASALAISGCMPTKPCCETSNKNGVGHPVAAAPVEMKQTPVVTDSVSSVSEKKPELLKISGIGYGAESTFAAYTPGQRRLMAIRASKLDAYRALAEQLYGIKIDSNTSISTLTAKSDSFRARVNAVVRGARVISVTPMADNNYETVLEVYVDKRFFEEAFVYSSSNSVAVEPDSVYKVNSY